MNKVLLYVAVCVAISLALATNFALSYYDGSFASSLTTLNPPATIVKQEPLSIEAIETANMVGMGVIGGAIVLVSVLAFYRKPEPSDEAI